MPTSIPKILHFYWGGCPLPEKELANLFSFLQHTDETWTIYLWTDHLKNIWDSPGFKRDIEVSLPKRVKVRTVGGLLEDVLEKLQLAASADPFFFRKMGLYVQSSSFFSEAIQTIHQLITGLAAPAAAKDCLVPFFLYAHGGHYFDLDTTAIGPLQEQKSSHGLLLLEQGGYISGIATSPNHAFCLRAIYCIKLLLKEEIKFLDNKRTLFDLAPLKNRRSERHIGVTCNTTGCIISEAFNWYCGIQNARTNKKNHPNIVFETTYPRENNEKRNLRMGVKLDLTKNHSIWRASNNPRFSFEIDNADLFSSQRIIKNRLVVAGNIRFDKIQDIYGSGVGSFTNKDAPEDKKQAASTTNKKSEYFFFGNFNATKRKQYQNQLTFESPLTTDPACTLIDMRARL